MSDKRLVVFILATRPCDEIKRKSETEPYAARLQQQVKELFVEETSNVDHYTRDSVYIWVPVCGSPRRKN